MLMKGDKVVDSIEIGSDFFLLCFLGHYNREVYKYVLVKMFYSSTCSLLTNIIHQKRRFKILEKIPSIHYIFVFYFNIEDACI